nr:signal peptidase I [Cohnella nanjingensis]
MDQPREWNDEAKSDPLKAAPATPEAREDMPGGQAPSVLEGGADDPGSPKKPNESKVGKEVMEWVKALVIAGVLVIVIRWLLFNPFIVDGPSMQPNFWNGERIIVNKVVYDIRKPHAGEVIVFHVPDEGRDYIKRVIGVPGDTIKVQGDDVYVNGEKIAEPYLAKTYEQAHAAGGLYNEPSDHSDFPNDIVSEGKVPEGSLFVMGDNRPDSKDSRMIGYVPISRVVGRAELIFWPLGKIHYIGRGY